MNERVLKVLEIAQYLTFNEFLNYIGILTRGLTQNECEEVINNVCG